MFLLKFFPFESRQKLNKSMKLSKSWRYIFSGLKVQNKILNVAIWKFLLLHLAEYHKREYLTIKQNMSSSNSQEE